MGVSRLFLTWATCLLLAGCTSRSSDDETANSAPPPVSVQVALAEQTTLRPELELVGNLVAIPERTAVVSPQLGGWVKKLDIVEGQLVRASDVLIELDARSASVDVQRAEAMVAEKEAVLTRLKSGYLPAEIAGARQDADQMAATVDGLRNELVALKELLDRREVSTVLYETKAKALEASEAALASAQERVKLLEAGTRPEMITEAQASLDVAKADLEQAKLTLEWCSITSPIDGIVVQLIARKGRFYDRAVPLATIIDLSDVFVQLSVPSGEFAKVRKGTRVEIQLNAIPDRTFSGQVERIRGEADPLTGNVVIFVLVKNNDQLLLPGLTCRARISLPEIRDALAVPVTAVADNAGTPVVVVVRDGMAYEIEVETGIETREAVQILKGLSAGDLVVTAGGYGLPDGCPVQVVADLAAIRTGDSGQDREP